MLDTYLPKIKKFLGTDNLDIQQTLFGYAVIKGNWIPSETTTIHYQGLKLNLKGRVLHERVLLFNKDIGLRSHEEESQEIVINIGSEVIKQVMPLDAFSFIYLGRAAHSMNGDYGFVHGFNVENTGLLYVAKALKQEFVQGNSFIVPPNSFKF